MFDFFNSPSTFHPSTVRRPARQILLQQGAALLRAPAVRPPAAAAIDGDPRVVPAQESRRIPRAAGADPGTFGRGRQSMI